MCRFPRCDSRRSVPTGGASASRVLGQPRIEFALHVVRCLSRAARATHRIFHDSLVGTAESRIKLSTSIGVGEYVAGPVHDQYRLAYRRRIGQQASAAAIIWTPERSGTRREDERIGDEVRYGLQIVRDLLGYNRSRRKCRHECRNGVHCGITAFGGLALTAIKGLSPMPVVITSRQPCIDNMLTAINRRCCDPLCGWAGRAASGNPAHKHPQHRFAGFRNRLSNPRSPPLHAEAGGSRSRRRRIRRCSALSRSRGIGCCGHRIRAAEQRRRAVSR